MNSINFQYIPIATIANRIMKHPLLRDMNFSDIVSHAVDVLDLVRVPGQKVEAICYKPIVEFKAQIPVDNKNILSIDYVKNNKQIPMVMGSDGLHNHLASLPKGRNNNTVYTYTINDGMINTNQKDGQVLIKYEKFKTDEDGLPMIPDEVSLVKAIENYIKVQVFTILVDLGKLPGSSLHRAEQEYAWYIGKAQTTFQGFINEDDTESFLRGMKRMMPEGNTHAHRDMYKVNRELKNPN
jgi:hypothetical protein